MASIIRSSQTSVASIFDLFGVTANTAVKLVQVAATGVDMLSEKAQTMGDRVKLAGRFNRHSMITEEISLAVDRHLDIVEASHAKNMSTSFNREAEYIKLCAEYSSLASAE